MHPKKGLKMQFIIELNRRYETGYQLRIIDGPVNMVMDEEPFPLDEALCGAAAALEEYNKDRGTNYDLCDVLILKGGGIEINKLRDVTSAKIAEDIRTKAGKYIRQPEPEDYTKQVVDGKEEILISARGVLLYAYMGWCEEESVKSQALLMQYCGLLARKGKGKGSMENWNELRKLDKNSGIKWLKETYGRYIDDAKEVMDLMKRI